MANVQGSFVWVDPVTGIPGSKTMGRYIGIFPLMEYATSASVLAVDGQPALDLAVKAAAAQGGIVLFPPGIITLKQVQLFDAIYYVGCGAKVTTINQSHGANASLFVNASNKGPTSFLNMCGVSNMTIKKANAPALPAVSDTIGCGIELKCRMGELCHFNDLIFQNWAQSGIRLNNGGQPVVIRDIHAFGCKEYGIDLRRGGGDVWHLLNLDTISGDNHGKALIHIQGGGSPMETISIYHVKIESIQDNTMPCAIEFDGMNGTRVAIADVDVYAIKPIPALIRISSSTIKILGGLVGASGPSGASVETITNLIDDIPAGRQIPYSNDRLDWAYRSTTGFKEGL